MFALQYEYLNVRIVAVVAIDFAVVFFARFRCKSNARVHHFSIDLSSIIFLNNKNRPNKFVRLIFFFYLLIVIILTMIKHKRNPQTHNASAFMSFFLFFAVLS